MQRNTKLITRYGNASTKPSSTASRGRNPYGTRRGNACNGRFARPKPEAPKPTPKPFTVEAKDPHEWFDTFTQIQKGELPRRGFTLSNVKVDDELASNMRTTIKVVGGEKDQDVSFRLSTRMDYSPTRLEKDGGFNSTGSVMQTAKILREQGTNVRFDTTIAGQQTMVMEKEGVRCRVGFGWSSTQEKPTSDDKSGDPTKSFYAQYFDLWAKSDPTPLDPKPTDGSSQNFPIEIELVDKDNAGLITITKADDLTKQVNGFARFSEEFTKAYYQARNAQPPEHTVKLEIPDWDHYVGDDPALASVGQETSGDAFSRLFMGQRTTEEVGYLLTEEEKAAMPTFAEIGGQRAAVDEAIKLVMSIKHANTYEKRGVARPKGILLVGPPGTGKTMLAKAVAREAGTEFMSLSVTDLVSKWYGEAEQRAQKFFDRAKSLADQGKDVIAFIDEIDSVVPSREGAHEATQKMVSVFLQNMDGLRNNPRLTILAATNQPENLDEAFLRPGRLDKKIRVGLPDEDGKSTEGRAQILSIHLQKHLNHSTNKSDLIAPNLNLHDIAGSLGKVSGADIESIVNLALEEKATAEIRFLEGDTVNGRQWSPLTGEELLAARNKYMPLPKQKAPMGFVRREK